MNDSTTIKDPWATFKLVTAFLLFMVVMLAGGIYIVSRYADQVYQENSVQARIEASDLGDELTFPEGWTPTACETFNNDRGNPDCRWVCESMNHPKVYRYCTPTIQSSDSE